jgi:hypothetical protein
MIFKSGVKILPLTTIIDFNGLIVIAVAATQADG